MRKLISLIFEVIKAWLARSKTPPKPAETKQKISLTVVGDNNNVAITIKNGSKS